MLGLRASLCVWVEGGGGVILQPPQPQLGPCYFCRFCRSKHLGFF